MIDEQFLQTIPQYGIGGFVGKIFKKVKDTVKKVAPIAGAIVGGLIYKMLLQKEENLA